GDLAAPGAGLPAARLDELLEAIQVALHARGDQPRGVAHVLHDAFGIVLQLEHDARLAVAQPVERDDARVARAAGAAPRDAVVRDLLLDRRRPLLLLAADVRAPAQAPVVELRDLLDAFHEARELLELRPLVVRRPDGNIHIDRSLDGSHVRHLLGVSPPRA